MEELFGLLDVITEIPRDNHLKIVGLCFSSHRAENIKPYTYIFPSVLE